VRLEDLSSGQQFYVYNLHLDHRSLGPTRQISAVRLIELIMRHSGPSLVTGDFNTSETSPTMTFFYGQTALTNDQGVLFTNPIPFVDAFKYVYPGDPRSLIDHVLVESGVAILGSAYTQSGDASDHNIVSCDLSF
jgi:endonuclease/exonuclease/phosphatase (EEP) superfamily protein YafD